MVLGLGPVLRYELITTARRGRYYLARVVYGFFLLALLVDRFAVWEANHPGGGRIDEVHRFAEETFILFGEAQLMALLCLLPALVAGVIADDHQRKTLHYLLASRLSSGEIVFGKLGARLIHVGTFVALGLPVVALLLLYGGLNPENVLYVYLGTFTTVMSVAGFAILISVLARRPRDAVLVTYAVEAIWLLGPPAIHPIATYLDGSLSWVAPLNNVLLLTNPIVVLGELSGTRYGYLQELVLLLDEPVPGDVHGDGGDSDGVGYPIPGPGRRRPEAAPRQFLARSQAPDGLVDATGDRDGKAESLARGRAHSLAIRSWRPPADVAPAAMRR